MTDEEAEAGARADQDNPPADEAWLAAGRLVLPSPKQAISLRVDRDVLEWFKAQKGRYQTLMNAVLRAYKEHHSGHGKGGRRPS